MELNEKETTFLYNSKKIEDRQTLGYLMSKSDMVLNERDLYHDNLTESQLLEVRDQLNIPLKELLTSDKDEASNYDDEALLKLMAYDSANIRTPIILSKERSYIVDSPLSMIKE